ncbi:hypothetical protein [Mycobacteroides abscessus]|uniref:hypothetical protein n=1 Tax=Mycobacteroides abscessus TaxID=36809 RepID=UPI001F469AAB|nr:hypothetical protein [Mycobacteroides abscessus]
MFTDDAHNVYIGQAAHCASTGTSKDTDGCTSVSRPLGTPVTFNRGGRPMSPGEVVGGGELIYSSWLTMQNNHEQDSNNCAYNDFALVKAEPQKSGHDRFRRNEDSLPRHAGLSPGAPLWSPRSPYQ